MVLYILRDANTHRTGRSLKKKGNKKQKVKQNSSQTIMYNTQQIFLYKKSKNLLAYCSGLTVDISAPACKLHSTHTCS